MSIMSSFSAHYGHWNLVALEPAFAIRAAALTIHFSIRNGCFRSGVSSLMERR